MPNVLVATEQESLYAACRQQLGNDGIAVHRCASGLSCLQWLREHPADVLVLDASLPWGGADGVLELLPADINRHPQPLVFLVATEVSATLLYRMGRYRVDDFQIGLHNRTDLGVRIRRLINRG